MSASLLAGVSTPPAAAPAVRTRRARRDIQSSLRCSTTLASQKQVKGATSVRCKASGGGDGAPDDQQPTRRGFLSAAAAVVANVQSFGGPALAYSEPPYAADVTEVQNAYFAATSKAAHPERWYPYWWAGAYTRSLFSST
jgi:hypothetical protein